MKKVLITMTVLASMVAGAMVFSSFTTSKQDAEKEYVQIETGVPVYWEGNADYNGSGSDYLYIKVYQTEGQCNSFYAVVTEAFNKSNIGKELWVKENPNYNPNGSDWNTKKYHVTCGNKDYYFSM